MIVINKELEKEKWFDYDEDVKFLIKPFPISERALRPGMATSYGDILYRQAVYCLKDWKGVVSIDGKDIKFTKDNVEFIFKYSEALIQWVCIKSVSINSSIVNIEQKKI